MSTSVEEFLAKNDYMGALKWLEARVNAREGDRKDSFRWIGYICGLLKKWSAAATAYSRIKLLDDMDADAGLCQAICYFHRKEYQNAEHSLWNSTDGPLKNRLLYHLASQQKDQQKHESKLDQRDVLDRLSIAAMAYIHGRYEEAATEYKERFEDNPDCAAFPFFAAMCYCKLNQQPEGLSETLNAYLQQYPGDLWATNICASFSFSTPMSTKETWLAASEILSRLEVNGYDISGDPRTLHNKWVFSEGHDDAATILPPYMSTLPEARINMAIYHLSEGDAGEAFNIIKDMQLTSGTELMLKAGVYATLGQSTRNYEYITTANECYEQVAISSAHRGTLMGIKCMGSARILQKNFTDAAANFDSICGWVSFHPNYGVVLAATGRYKEAVKALAESPFWLCKSLIMTGDLIGAWDLYFVCGLSGAAEVKLLKLIAHTCYEMGHFVVAAKAFWLLECMMDDSHQRGKLLACAAVYQMWLGGKASEVDLTAVLHLLDVSAQKQRAVRASLHPQKIATLIRARYAVKFIMNLQYYRNQQDKMYKRSFDEIAKAAGTDAEALDNYGALQRLCSGAEMNYEELRLLRPLYHRTRSMAKLTEQERVDMYATLQTAQELALKVPNDAPFEAAEVKRPATVAKVVADDEVEEDDAEESGAEDSYYDDNANDGDDYSDNDIF